jgi:DNA-binding CsgD family transcriptional regulator
LKGRLSNQEIADTLFISPETVKRHLYNIYKKLSVKNRREASAKIAALNILTRKPADRTPILTAT